MTAIREALLRPLQVCPVTGQPCPWCDNGACMYYGNTSDAPRITGQCPEVKE